MRLALVLLQTPGVHEGRLGDDTTYYLAGRAVLTGADPYANPSFRQWPAVAAAFSALALLPPGFALRVWPLGVAAAVAVAGVLVWRSVAVGSTAGLRRVGAVWTSLVLLGLPTLFTVYQGQSYGAVLPGLRARPHLARAPTVLGRCRVRGDGGRSCIWP